MKFGLLTTALASLAIALPLAAKDDLPDTTEEGLVRIQGSELAAVYAMPGANLSGYNRVKVLEPYVAFRKNWQRDQNRGAGMRATTQDMERIKSELAAEFQKVFAEVLEANDGYPVVDEVGADVLIVRPAIIDLNPTAPDLQRPGRTETYAESAGDMSLYVEIYDSETSALIAKAIDRKADRGFGYVTWTNRVTNRQAADRILKEWAQALRDALDRAHQQDGSGG